MFSALRNERSSACISDMRFDAWLANELDATRTDELQRHLRECVRCRSRKLQLLRYRVSFAREYPATPSWLESEPETRRDTSSAAKKSRTSWLLAGVCVAAALLLTVMTPHDFALRTKGGSYLSFYVKRGEDVHRGRLRERLAEGDKLRFAYTALTPQYLAILSLDGAGRANQYYPAGPRAAWIDAGADMLLPSAVELDDVLGEERIVALFCDSAVQVAPLLAALSAEQIDLHRPNGCTLDELVVIKQANTP